MNQQPVVFGNEKASLNRPAWSSEQSTGNFEAYKHYHGGRGKAVVVKNYYKKTTIRN